VRLAATQIVIGQTKLYICYIFDLSTLNTFPMSTFMEHAQTFTIRKVTAREKQSCI